MLGAMTFQASSPRRESVAIIGEFPHWNNAMLAATNRCLRISSGCCCYMNVLAKLGCNPRQTDLVNLRSITWSADGSPHFSQNKNLFPILLRPGARRPGHSTIANEFAVAANLTCIALLSRN